MAKSNYTDSLVATLAAQPVWTYAQAVAFAEENGLKVRSVVAKVKSMGLDYERKPIVTKTGEPVEKKAAIVSDIEIALGVPADTFADLSKCTKQVLETLRQVVSVDTDNG